MSEAAAKQFKDEASRISNNYHKSIQSTIKRIEGQSKTYGLNTGNIFSVGEIINSAPVPSYLQGYNKP